jgi:dienelactone hydrolase
MKKKIDHQKSNFMVISTEKFKLALVLTIVMLLYGSFYSNPMNVMAKSNSSYPTSVLKDKAALKKQTSDYVSQFKKGNFDDFYKASTKQLQQKITISILEQGWDAIIAVTGKPGKSISCTYARQNGLHVVTEKIRGTLYNINVTISYNTKGKAVGIWTNFIPKDPPKPQTTDKWEEFSITVGEKKLPGMLTLPKGVQEPPVVIMIQGSGSSDMNMSVGTTPNRPFEDIAHGLAEQGIATLRYNKRTYQYPAGGGDTIEYEILDDAAAATKMLCNDKRVDTNRIYLLGHSLGGMFAPKITSDNPQIKGFISLAGSLRPLQDIMLDQNKAALDAEPSLTKQQKNDLLVQIKNEIAKITSLDDGGTNFIMGMPTNYWRSFNAIDNLVLAKNLNVPMLILQGSVDFQVYPDKDYTLWQTTLKDHTNVTYHLYDGLSHEFMPNQLSKNGAPDISVYNAPNHVDPQVITDIAVWVKGL